MNKTAVKGTVFAILAAALYALNSPISKLLLTRIQPTMMAAFLYLGAGTSMLILGLVQKKTNTENAEKPLTKKDLPYTIGMIVLDIAAPIFLMTGLSQTTAANASLLNNFEIVATSLIALFIFWEMPTLRFVIALVIMIIGTCLI